MNIGPADNYADSSMVDESLREFAMTSIKDLKVGHLNIRSL